MRIHISIAHKVLTPNVEDLVFNKVWQNTAQTPDQANTKIKEEINGTIENFSECLKTKFEYEKIEDSF